MELETYLTKRDYIYFNLHHIKNQKNNFDLIIYIVLVFISFVYFILINYNLALFSSMLFACVVVYLISRFLKYRPNILSYKYFEILLKYASKDKNINEFIGNQKITLKDDCIELISEYSTEIYYYNKILSIENDDERYYIYVGSLKAIIIPFSAFDNSSVNDVFIDFLKSKNANL